MANTNSPSFAKIGFVIFIGVLAIVATLIYLGGLRGGDEMIYAETYYEKSVSGLSVGSPVNFRGVKLGEVCEISFVGDHYRVYGVTNQLIYVKMAFPRRHLMNDDITDDRYVDVSRLDRFSEIIRTYAIKATVTASGITGLSRIELDNRPDLKEMEISWKPHNAYIPPAVSLLDSFSDSATRVMNQINKMDMTSVWSNVAATVQAVSKTMEGAQTIMETRMGDVDKIMNNLAEITGSLKELVNEVKENPSLLIRERIADPLPETQR